MPNVLPKPRRYYPTNDEFNEWLAHCYEMIGWGPQEQSDDQGEHMYHLQTLIESIVEEISRMKHDCDA